MSRYRPIVMLTNRTVATSICAGVLLSCGIATAQVRNEYSKPGASDADINAAYVFGTQRIHVNLNAAGLNNGSSWANAYRYLQDALVAAQPGDEIWVAQGTYKPDRGAGVTLGDRSATFQLESGVALYGGFNGTETLLNQRNPTLNTTILSGDLLSDDIPVACTQNAPDCDSFGKLCVNGSCIIRTNNAENSYHVVTGSGTDATAILDGFTITAGLLNAPPNGGAGMENVSGSPTVTSCTFIGNSATSGGSGVMFNFQSSPTVTNCTFSGNRADLGGGMYNNGGSPTVTNCTFSGNSAFFGGGMYNFFGPSSSLTVINCTFSGNSADFGGGMYNDGNTPMITITNCVFCGNSANGQGGAMCNVGSSPTLTNCTFSGNSAFLDGGGMTNILGSNPVVTNCAFSGNSASSFGGGMSNDGPGTPTVTNGILWGNSDSGGMGESGQIYAGSGTPVVNYSIVQGGWSGAGGTGTLNADPLFFDRDGVDNVVGTIDDDLRLRTFSPGIDVGNDASVPADTLDLDGDLNVVEPIPFDLAGNSRFIGTVDMGAYEYFPDCNNNGIDDFVIEIADCACDPACDCNCNGILDVCEIADCSGDPGCDDCNLNGVLDVCDIAFLTSMDMNMNNVPDECCAFVAGCPAQSIVWSCFDNWDLPGDVYPDSATFMGMHPAVTLDQNDLVFLDVDSTIETIRIVDTAELSVRQTGAAGDLNFASPAQLQINGKLLIAGSRAIGSAGVPPEVTVGPAGIYKAYEAATAGVVSASLTASTLSVVGNDCLVPPCPEGGQITLTDSMSLTTTGNLMIDGRLANGECQLHREDQAAALSFHTPPSIRLTGPGTQINIGDILSMQGAAGFLNESNLPVVVGGDWDNQSVRPDCFDSVLGIIRMDGASPQTFEAAAADTGGAGGSSNDFRIGTLEIAAGSDVTVQDSFDNDLQGQASCGEAQYVGILMLEAGATLTVQDCRLYYDSLVKDPSAQIIQVGCGEARAAVNPPAPDADPTGLSKSRALSFVPPAGEIAGGSTAGAIRVSLVSLHHVEPPYSGGASIPFTAFEGQVRWVGPPTQYMESTSSETSFMASALQCSPYYHDWSTISLLHVFGSAVVPSSSYRVQILAESCLGIEDRCTAGSPVLTVNTTRWADVEQPYNPPSDTVQPDLGDIGGLVNKFRSAIDAPIKARALLAGDDAFGNITTLGSDLNFGHIAACVDAFRGKPYPFIIQSCP